MFVLISINLIKITLLFIIFQEQKQLNIYTYTEYGEAIPWFNLQGTADQIKSNIKFNILLGNGDIEVVEKLRYDGTKWIKIK
ncbi:hypothetical protein ACI76O_11820 [Capnocytophaga cynodegmi]